MSTVKWKVADLAKIRKMNSKAQGKKTHMALKALKKSAGDAKKASGELTKLIKDEGA